jgi:hypothetical protein
VAGGVNAAVVPCLKCGSSAHSTHEGQEDDYYKCTECGFKFGIDWSYDGPPQTPCWPVSQGENEKRRKWAAPFLGVLPKSGSDRSD